jgi:uncharacterized protein YjbI with pentapeptide repeats
MRLSRSLGITCLAVLLAGTTLAQEQATCPHPEGWKPTEKDLQRILSNHKQWAQHLEKWILEQTLAVDPEPVLPKWAESISGRANLCNVDLNNVKLDGATLGGARLNRASLHGAELKNVKLPFAELNNAWLGGAKLEKADLRWAKLNNAYLAMAELNEAELNYAELNDAHLGADGLQKMPAASLKGAYLSRAKLNGAQLIGVELTDASLSDAELKGADLIDAKLDNAKLDGAQLEEADLTGASLAGAHLANANLTNAIYAPVSGAPDAYVAGIKGLDTVTFPAGQEIGLVQLRELVQKAGLRDLERQATFAIEHGKTWHAIFAWDENPRAAAEGFTRTVAFDWTTRYGLYPGRALTIIAVLWLVSIPIYFWPIRLPPKGPSVRGIYQVWPSDRITSSQDKVSLSSSAEVNRLERGTWGALCYGAYFSLLSAFNIGWRELNVGAWIVRLQPREYVLRATGWVRVVSGAQSLLSVYLLAMWVLTYFGRPFQ